MIVCYSNFQLAQLFRKSPKTIAFCTLQQCSHRAKPCMVLQFVCCLLCSANADALVCKKTLTCGFRGRPAATCGLFGPTSCQKVTRVSKTLSSDWMNTVRAVLGARMMRFCSMATASVLDFAWKRWNAVLSTVDASARRMRTLVAAQGWKNASEQCCVLSNSIARAVCRKVLTRRTH